MGGKQNAVEREVLGFWMEGVVVGVARTQAKPYLGFATSFTYFISYY